MTPPDRTERPTADHHDRLFLRLSQGPRTDLGIGPLGLDRVAAEDVRQLVEQRLERVRVARLIATSRCREYPRTLPSSAAKGIWRILSAASAVWAFHEGSSLAATPAPSVWASTNHRARYVKLGLVVGPL